jgi:hypothetical protein
MINYVMVSNEEDFTKITLDAKVAENAFTSGMFQVIAVDLPEGVKPKEFHLSIRTGKEEVISKEIPLI